MSVQTNKKMIANYMRGRGVFLNNRSMDNLFFLKPHELVARNRKEINRKLSLKYQ